MTTLVPVSVELGALASCISPPSLRLAFVDISVLTDTLPGDTMLPASVVVPVLSNT